VKRLWSEPIEKTVIAYVSVCAIGAGKNASSADDNEVGMHIRKVVANITSDSVDEQIVIQYGGSLKPDNIEELLGTSDIDGALVGGASLDTASFKQLVEKRNQAT